MRLQVQRRVGDVDRVVVGRDLALVLRELLGRTPSSTSSGAGLTFGAPHQQVRAAAVRDAVHLAVDRVPRLVLQAGEDVGVVRDQVGVDRRDVAAGDQAQRRVARGRHAVVLAGAHQRDHLVGGVADLDVDLAAGLLLERRDPVDLRVGRAVLGVAGPGDDVQLALARRRRLLRPASLGGLSPLPLALLPPPLSLLLPHAATPNAAMQATTAAHRPFVLMLPPDLGGPSSIAYVCSGTPRDVHLPAAAPRAPPPTTSRGSAGRPEARRPRRARRRSG